MKKSYVLAGVMILAAVLMFLPAGAKAEMYVEGYLGGVQPANAPMDFHNNGVPPVVISSHTSGRMDPAVVGGLKIGTWFVKEGFLGYNYPDWMKYLGFYLDFSYHRMDFRNQKGSSSNNFGVTAYNNFFSEGTAATLAFMFAARYGFFPDSEVPFGRLQPYVAVGPAILFASQQPSLRFPSQATTGRFEWDGESRSTTAFCLAVDAGVRWMALKNVSIDVFFNYRYSEPTFDSRFYNPFSNSTDKINMKPTFNIFGWNVGAAYHF